MKQIKIENNGVEQLITVPENSKVTIDGNVVVFEPKFNKGDIVYQFVSDRQKAMIIILAQDYSFIVSNKSIDSFAHIDLDGKITFTGHFATNDVTSFRISTDSEKQLLFDALAKEGKQWNAEKLCIEDFKVVPKVGDYCRIDFIGVGSGIHDYLVYGGKKGDHKSKGNIFSTKDGINTYMSYSNDVEFTVIPKEQFQSELAQLGFEYNFENDTISELNKYGHFVFIKDKKAEYKYLEINSDLTSIISNCVMVKSKSIAINIIEMINKNI